MSSTDTVFAFIAVDANGDEFAGHLAAVAFDGQGHATRWSGALLDGRPVHSTDGGCLAIEGAAATMHLRHAAPCN